ncbi:amino acid ABC transporter substrate-binding protein [Clostridium botulinum]|uniref:Amino acid ABC transporter substrate-binding protein n=1 Tax=Clostridium botulinum TaxID=1491 RepID=A0A6G4CTL8_CLOBO|nr:amino acid ABC transporter substrate-binding protein [Clostridium botulinum]NFA01103.1 amino acid ABC transporter substrate-binding protein [Clostridium botulinum]NFA31069.1 amino acid ABC transporter substrate-binding protein [Clostridium botulinum]NFA85688.1 amino acid ABC transporter substrate-binding protein [Clostridium botulinum]NFB05857.1 amino acid ABC transporter substrate-binding protein [Clostridium botulinum]
MKKKNILFSILIMGLIFILTGCDNKSKEDTSLKDIKAKGEFVVGLDDSFPPMGFKNDKGEIVGFDIDLAKEVAKKMGVKVVFKPVQWDGVVLSLNNKDIDVIWNGLTITEKRKEQINFSKPYVENKQIIVVNNDSNIKSKKDLNKKTVAIQLGSSSEVALDSDKDFVKSLKELKKYSNNTEALMDLQAKRVDAVVVDEVVGRYYISKKPNVFKVLDEDFGGESYGIGFRKTDNSFRESVDKALDEVIKDGTSDKISEKWFGKGILKK